MGSLAAKSMGGRCPGTRDLWSCNYVLRQPEPIPQRDDKYVHSFDHLRKSLTRLAQSHRYLMSAIEDALSLISAPLWAPTLLL